MAFYRASVGLFIAASVSAIAGVLTLAWYPGWMWRLVLFGVVFGILGYVVGAAAAFFSKPPESWWKAYAIGLALFVASYAAAPIASAISSVTYFWAHRADADRIATILGPLENASVSSRDGACEGVNVCNELVNALHSFGGVWARSGNSYNKHSAFIYMRGDFYALHCPRTTEAGCSDGWSIPVGGDWYLRGSCSMWTC